MRDSRWRDLRRIKIRSIDVILATLVMLVFFRTAEYGTKETEAIGVEEEMQYGKITGNEIKTPIAGVTLAMHGHALANALAGTGEIKYVGIE